MSADAAGSPKGHHRANLIAMIAGFAASLVTGLWFTPYLATRLGPAVFGLLPLATTVVSYFSLLNQTLGASVTRTLVVSLSSGEADRANRVFGTMVSASGIAAVLMVVPLAVLAIASPAMFSIPAGMEDETQLLFAVIGVSFLFTLVGVSFTAVSFSVNRIYLTNIAALVQTVLRIVLTVAAFELIAPRLGLAALAILLAGVGSFALTIYFARRAIPWLQLFRFRYDAEVMRGVTRTSTHQMVMQFGTVIVMSCEIVLVNQLFGDYEAGRYAAVIQWLFVLRNVSTSLVSLFIPTVLASHARNDVDGTIAVTCRAMRWTGIAVALPAGYLCGLAPEVLHVWIGPVFAGLWPVMSLQLAALVLISAALPLYTVTLAADRVLLSGFVQVATGVGGILLAILFSEFTALGLIGVALGVHGLLLVKEVTFIPMFAARNLGRSPAPFYRAMFPGAVVFLAAAGTARLLGWGFALASYPTLFVAGLAVSAVALAVALAAAGRGDRALLLGALPIGRFIPARRGGGE